jgi:hypothetical protein
MSRISIPEVTNPLPSGLHLIAVIWSLCTPTMLCIKEPCWRDGSRDQLKIVVIMVRLTYLRIPNIQGVVSCRNQSLVIVRPRYRGDRLLVALQETLAFTSAVRQRL